MTTDRHTTSPSTPSSNPAMAFSSTGFSFDLGPHIGVKHITVTNIAHSVTIKLDQMNYLLWQVRILPVIRNQGLAGFNDGTLSQPDPSSPTFDAWEWADQTIQSWIMATLSPSAIGQVLDAPSVAAKWAKLPSVHASNLQVWLIRLRIELQHLKKGSPWPNT